MISLIHPSRGRPKKAKETFDLWVENMKGSSVDYILSLDLNDPCLTEYQKIFPDYHYVVNDNQSVVQATNYAAKRTEEDILIYLSDDFDCPKHWDALIEEEFYKVTTARLLKVDDCLQPIMQRVVTIPIMNRQLYELLGYFWNPLYKSMFVDQDLYEVCEKNGWLKFAPELKFPHNHVSVGKAPDDDTYRRSAANWNQGKEVFRRRQAAGFPL